MAAKATLIALRLAILPDATKLDDVVAEIADELSSWTIAEPELAKLIERSRKARKSCGTIGDAAIAELITALEQQIAARQAAEDRALPDDCTPMLKSGIEALDIYINQLRGQVEAARTALVLAQEIVTDHPGWLSGNGVRISQLARAQTAIEAVQPVEPVQSDGTKSEVSDEAE